MLNPQTLKQSFPGCSFTLLNEVLIPHEFMDDIVHVLVDLSFLALGVVVLKLVEVVVVAGDLFAFVEFLVLSGG